MAETDERVTNLFTKKSHHCNTSVIYLVQNLFPKKQGESHHQFEFTIHCGVQESARCVANDYIGQSDVPRSSQVCSGGVRRCDVHSLRVHFGRSETGHPRGSTLAHVHTTGRRCSVCIHAKSINSRVPCVTPYSTMSLHVTCLYWYNAELRKAQSLKAVLVGELCEAAYGRFDAAAPLTHRQQQPMRMYTAHLRSRIKRVTSECDKHSRFVWPREGTSSLLVEDHSLMSRRCMRMLKGELKRRRCLKFILVCQLCLPAYELLEVTALLSRGQQRSMRRFTINLRSCIKTVTRRDDSQSSDVWSREETRSLSSDAQQDE